MAQKLNPKLKEMYDKVMSTPTKKPAEAPMQKAEPRAHPTTPPPTPPKSPFLSSMPIQPVKNFGVKAFTFSGGKTKVSKEEKESKKAEVKTEHQQAAASQPQKKKASGFLIALVILGFVIAWGLFWAYWFKFI